MGPGSYDDLQAEGATLRGQLAVLDPSLESIDAYLRSVRSWQVRCQEAVTLRTPGQSAGFRTATGPPQELLGYAWFPTPGWTTRVDQSLVLWMDELKRVQSSRHPRRPGP
jgi:hypothetical protein